MKQIKVQSLTQDAFRRYGEYIDILNDAELAKASVFPRGFFADVIGLEFSGVLQPTVSVNSLRREEKNLVRFVELHHHTCEGILPVDSDVILFVGLPDRGKVSDKYIEAFLIPKGTFVKLNPLIVHGSVFPVEETAHSLCLLSGRTFANDMEAKLLGDEDVLELVL